MTDEIRWQQVGFDAHIERGRRVRFLARSHPALTFDVLDSIHQRALARVHIWDANPELVRGPRWIDTDPWNLDSRVEAEVAFLDADGSLHSGLNAKGRLQDIFEVVVEAIEVQHKEHNR